jgi:hypothetical protein
MTLEVLSSSESLSLCRAAAGLVLNRFRRLAHQTEQEDRKLSQLMTELADEVERNLVEIHQLDGQDRLPEALDEASGQRVARGFLPSLSKNCDGVRLDRESGFYLMECILEELAGFYSTLVRQSSDERSRDLLLRLKLAVADRLEFLRHVVL